MVPKGMAKASSIPAEKKLVASKTRLKIMLQDLNRMCDESEKAVVIQGQLSLVEKLFEETDALQSAFEEGLEAEEQEASIIEWSGYRLDFLRSQARAHEVAGQGLADRAAPQELKTAEKVYALTALGKDPRTSDLSVAEVLIALCREQLPESVQFRWDELAQANNAVVADLPAFLRFLQQQTDLPGASRRSKEPTRERTKARRSGGERKRNSPESPPRGSATFLHAAVKRSCYICQKQHLPQQCPRLLRAGPHQRRELARRARLCFACLEPGHYASGCKHRGKTTDGKPVTASSPSTSASERSVAEQKTIVRSEEPSSAPVHANVATRSSQWTSRTSPPPWVSLGRPAHCLSSGSAESSTKSRMHSS
ncbi:zinc knuckle [Trichinella nativa]|uniref:Zinc knuckle n=1 Tax=Trichinella nativa TaxID=6335 RepID=A0A1Y3E6N7_9BILA|nr:zinc knuckle [Trichinella nativa]